MQAEQKRGEKKDFLVPKNLGHDPLLHGPKKNQTGPDRPNASGWYWRLREPISLLSLLSSDEL